jgi:hypothetical protein
MIGQQILGAVIPGAVLGAFWGYLTSNWVHGALTFVIVCVATIKEPSTPARWERALVVSTFLAVVRLWAERKHILG